MIGHTSSLAHSSIRGHRTEVLDSSVSRAPQSEPPRLPCLGRMAFHVRMGYLLHRSASHPNQSPVGRTRPHHRLNRVLEGMYSTETLLEDWLIDHMRSDSLHILLLFRYWAILSQGFLDSLLLVADSARIQTTSDSSLH